MDLDPTKETQKIPEFESDTEKTQYFADMIEACNTGVTTMDGTVYVKKSFVERLQGLVTKNEKVGRLGKLRDTHNMYNQIPVNAASPFTAVSEFTLSGFMAQDTAAHIEFDRTPEHAEVLEVISSTEAYVKYIKIIEMLAVEARAEASKGADDYSFDGSLSELIDPAIAVTLLRSQLSDIEQIEDLEDVVTCMGMVLTLVQITGKKSTYTNTANKLMSVSARMYPNVHEWVTSDPKAFANLRATYKNDTTTSFQKRATKGTIDSHDFTIQDIISYDMIDETTQKLAKLRNYADRLRDITVDNTKAILRKEVYDDDPVPSDEKIEALLKIMNQYGIAIPQTQKDSEETMLTSSGLTTELPSMELDWEVLPPGELEEVARDIVHESSEAKGSQRYIDLSRLTVLESIRQMWGADRSYYSRGVRKQRSVVHGEHGEEQPDEYIILVLQEVSSKTGEVMYEHAVADSPIAGPNAMFIYRQDATDHRHGWRNVMSVDKKMSERLGAKRLKHIASNGMELNDTMIRKAEHVLTADPDHVEHLQFNGIDKEGNIRVRAKKVGGATIRSVNDSVIENS